jgi:NADH-quinone oxidoreductase subunit H
LGVIIKFLILVFFFIWVRTSLPRIKYNHLMALFWKNVLPISISILMFLVLIYPTGSIVL